MNNPKLALKLSMTGTPLETPCDDHTQRNVPQLADTEPVTEEDFSQILRDECKAQYSDFAACLRRATERVSFPAALDKTRSMLYCFAAAWKALALTEEKAVLGSIDAAVALAFSAVMLSHNLHGSGVGSRRVARDRFVEGCRCLDHESDVPDALSGALYDEIASQPLAAACPASLATAKMEALDEQPVARQGWLMVKEVDSANATPDFSGIWRRLWARIYEHDAALFLTPQQWGLDSEIVVALPLQGLVVTGVGDDIPSTPSTHLAHGAEPHDTAEPASAGASPLQISGTTTSEAEEARRPNASHADAEAAIGAQGNSAIETKAKEEAESECKYSRTCFMLLVGSSSRRELGNFPRLLLSAIDDAEHSRSLAQTKTSQN